MALRLPIFGTSDAAIQSDKTDRSILADLIVGAAVMLGLWALVMLGRQMTGPIDLVGTPTTLSTDPWLLPYYAGRSLLRMFLGLIASTIFALILK